MRKKRLLVVYDQHLFRETTILEGVEEEEVVVAAERQLQQKHPLLVPNLQTAHSPWPPTQVQLIVGSHQQPGGLHGCTMKRDVRI